MAYDQRLADTERENAALRAQNARLTDALDAQRHETERARVEATELRAENERLTRERDEARAKLLIPGVMHCAKCGFGLVRTNLYAQSGTFGPGDNTTEPCPNGCGPLWPATWEHRARELMTDYEARRARPGG